MIAKDINEKALNCLATQKWEEAQALFFKNAKEFPSHETYNNLGYYLINEGLLCKNGQSRNALKLGNKYLLKAKEIKTSSINECAIVQAIEYQLRGKNKCREALCVSALNSLKKALELEYSDIVEYKCLRFSYMLNPQDKKLLAKARKLLSTFVCEESVSLYLSILQVNSLVDEGLGCIKKYDNLLDEIVKLMFYAKFQLYEEGYLLCKTVCESYSIDTCVFSAIIECCVNTGRYSEAIEYTKRIIDTSENFIHQKNSICRNDIFKELSKSDGLRKREIDTYISIPPTIDMCCYFGCNIHDIAW